MKKDLRIIKLVLSSPSFFIFFILQTLNNCRLPIVICCTHQDNYSLLYFRNISIISPLFYKACRFLYFQKSWNYLLFCSLVYWAWFTSPVIFFISSFRPWIFELRLLLNLVTSIFIIVLESCLWNFKGLLKCWKFWKKGCAMIIHQFFRALLSSDFLSVLNIFLLKRSWLMRLHSLFRSRTNVFTVFKEFTSNKISNLR